MRTRWQWRFDKKSIIFVAVFLPITCLLGAWQMQRAVAKQYLIDQHSQQQQLLPLTVEQLKDWQDADLNFRSIRLKGYFDNQRTLFLDNQVFRSKAGYQVLTPLKTDNGDWFLVDRGWVEAAMDRNLLPLITSVSREVEIIGQFYKPRPFTLKQQQIAATWPQRIQAIELDLLDQYFDHRLFHYTIRIDPESPLAYLSNWSTDQAMPPQRHYAYATQWFALALVLLIMALLANTNLRDFFGKSPP